MARYRKIYALIWDDEVFSEFSGDEQRVALYCLTGKPTNRIGLFCFSQAEAAEKLKLTLPRFRRLFQNVCKRLEWLYDEQRSVLYVPSWWKWNVPENPNVLKSCLDDLAEVPRTPLIETFAQNVRYLPEQLRETFRKRLVNVWGNVSGTLPQTLPEAGPDPFPKQEQEQEQEQERERKREGARAEGFEKLWQNYPRKEDKSKANKAWNKLDWSAELQQAMMAALELQKRSPQWSEDNGRFIPHFANWLADRRWEDETPTLNGPATETEAQVAARITQEREERRRLEAEARRSRKPVQLSEMLQRKEE
jgi:hypothetical protein